MSRSVLIIVLISTFMHAGWNLMARYARAEGEFYKKMLTITLLVGFFPAVISEVRTGSITPLAWACVIGAGICAAFYLFGLARAFNTSDFTIVYPVARSLPVVFIAAIDVLRGRYLTPLGWVGILLVAMGCLLVPLRDFGDVHLQNYFNKSSLWMVLAALGTVGYTYLDKVAAEVVQSGADTAARYGYFYFAVSYFPYVLLLRTIKKEPHPQNETGWLLPTFGALFGFGAYWLILWAYQLSPYASYIVAFRQFSIVIGAALAFVIYHEKGVAVRLTGASMIASGLIFIAGWGR